MPSPPQIVFMPGGIQTEVHLDRADTDGAFCLLVDHPPVGWSLPPHLHTDAAETIHVLEGEFVVTVDGRPEHLGAGQTVHIPAGVLHSNANLGDAPGRRLLIFSPAGMEEFFREAGSSSSEIEPGRAATAEAAVRHGWRFPPLD